MPWFGVDLGIKTGGVVQLYPDPLAIETLSVWERGPRVSSSSADLSRFIGRKVCAPILLQGDPEAHNWIALDWDQRDAFWGNRSASVQKAFLAGYVYRSFLSAAFSPVFIPPSKLRTLLGLPSRATKQEVWAAFSLKTRLVLPGSEHLADAAVLAWSLLQMVNDGNSTDTGSLKAGFPAS